MKKCFLSYKIINNNVGVLYFRNIQYNFSNNIVLFVRKLFYNYISGCKPIIFGINNVVSEYMGVYGFKCDMLEIILRVQLIECMLYNCSEIFVSITAKKYNKSILCRDFNVVGLCNIFSNYNDSIVDSNVPILNMYYIIIGKGVGFYSRKTFNSLFAKLGKYNLWLSGSFLSVKYFKYRITYCGGYEHVTILFKINDIKNIVTIIGRFFKLVYKFFKLIYIKLGYIISYCNCYLDIILALRIDQIIYNKMLLFYCLVKGIVFLFQLICIVDNKIFMYYSFNYKYYVIIKEMLGMLGILDEKS